MHPEEKRRRLAPAFVPLPRGYVSRAFAELAQAEIGARKPAIERILSEPPKPRGRPKKDQTAT